MTKSCPRCQGSHIVKNGRSRHGHQRWACTGCKLTFGEQDRRRVAEGLKQAALEHYLEGVGLRATERLVGVSHNSVMNWVRQEVAGKALQRPDPARVEVVEADELWSYVGQKKALSGSGGLLIELPESLLAGRWVIVTPERPEHWARRFLEALQSLTPATSGTATPSSSPKPSTSKAKRTPTRWRA